MSSSVSLKHSVGSQEKWLYAGTSKVFLSSLSLVYFAAFASLFVQLPGLYGSG